MTGCRIALAGALCVMVMAATACSGTRALSCPEGTERWVEYQLFMGRGGSDGEIVDDASWDAFL